MPLLSTSTFPREVCAVLSADPAWVPDPAGSAVELELPLPQALRVSRAVADTATNVWIFMVPPRFFTRRYDERPSPRSVPWL